MPITITEALAEVKTIDKRIAKKREFIRQYLARQEGIKDPLERNGGSVQVISQEMQAVGDLEDRIVEIRRGIQRANEATEISVNGTTRPIADWLIWRREISHEQESFLTRLSTHLRQVRDEAQRKGHAVVQATATTADQKPTDIVVNIDERELSTDIENLQDTLGQLDGQLSLKNATVLIPE